MFSERQFGRAMPLNHANTVLSDHPWDLINFEVFWAALVGIWLLYGLIALWVSTRSWHWFFKFAIFASITSPMRLIEAPDLMLMLLACCLTVWGGALSRAAFVKWWHFIRSADQGSSSETSKPVISLANILLLFASLAILLAMLRADFSGLYSWPVATGFGLAVGTVVLLGAWIALAKNKWIVNGGFLASLVGIVLILGYVMSSVGETSLFSFIFSPSFNWTGDFNLPAVAILTTLFTTCLAVVIVRWNQSPLQAWWSLSRIAAVLLVVCLASTLVAILDISRQLRTDYPPRFVGEKNADRINRYNELVAAGDQLSQSNTLQDISLTTPGPALRTVLTSHETEFKKVNEILSAPFVPRGLDIKNTVDSNSYMTELQAVRGIVRALVCKSKQELFDRNPDSAMQDACLIIKLRRPVAETKTILNELNAIAFEGIGAVAMVPTIGHASDECVKTTLADILEIESTMLDPEDLYKNDIAISRVTYFYNWIGRLIQLCQQADNRDRFERQIMEAIHRNSATRQQVIALVALEQYKRQHGSYPQRLEALVPEFLSQVPIDPFVSVESPTPLRYRTDPAGLQFTLYSLGEDRVDNGGKLDSIGYTGMDESDLNLKASVEFSMAEDAENRAALVRELEEDDEDLGM